MELLKTDRKTLGVVLLAIALVASVGFNVYLTTLPEPEVQEIPKEPKGIIVNTETIVVGQDMEGGPKNYDPQYSTSGECRFWMGLFYDQLVIFKGKDVMTPLPELAESWEVSADGRTYTFHLRKDAYFDSGNPFTAEDVVYSFDRLMTFPQKATYLLSMFGIKKGSTVALGKYTVQLTLSDSWAKGIVFQNIGKVGFILDKNELIEHSVAGEYGDYGDYGAEWLSDHTCGMSSYNPVERILDVKLVMELNPDYWQYELGINSLPPIKNIIWLHIPEDETLSMMMEKGDIDIAAFMGQPTVRELLKKTGFAYQEMGYPGHRSLAMNTVKPPFDDNRVRSAVRWSIDYDKIVEYYSPFGMKLQTMICQGIAGYLPLNPYYKNITKAKELLAEAGYQNGFDTELAIFAGNEALAAMLKNDFDEAGIRCSIKIISTADRRVMMKEHEFGIFISTFGVSYLDPDATYMRNIYTGGNYTVDNWMNYGVEAWGQGWVNETVNALIDEAKKTPSWSDRAPIYEEIEKILLYEGPGQMLIRLPGAFCYRTWVENFEPNNFVYWDVNEMYKEPTKWYTP